MIDKNEEIFGNKAIYRVCYILNKIDTEILILHEIEAIKDTYASMSIHSYFRLKEENILNTSIKLEAD